MGDLANRNALTFPRTQAGHVAHTRTHAHTDARTHALTDACICQCASGRPDLLYMARRATAQLVRTCRSISQKLKKEQNVGLFYVRGRRIDWLNLRDSVCVCAVVVGRRKKRKKENRSTGLDENACRLVCSLFATCVIVFVWLTRSIICVKLCQDVYVSFSFNVVYANGDEESCLDCRLLFVRLKYPQGHLGITEGSGLGTSVCRRQY